MTSQHSIASFPVVHFLLLLEPYFYYAIVALPAAPHQTSENKLYLRFGITVLAIAAMSLNIALQTFAAPAVICVDPGHPSETSRGTTGKHISEIDAAWAVAQFLRTDLDKRGYQVVLTKGSSEEFVTNKQRAQIANRAQAALLLRLHCDADAGTGIASYAPDRQGTVNGVTGPSAEVIASSQTALHLFHPAVIAALHGLLADRGSHPDTSTRIGGMQGALTGSIYSKVPVILVEMCVLTNPHDEAIIDNPSGQQKIASALAAGVDAVVNSDK